VGGEASWGIFAKRPFSMFSTSAFKIELVAGITSSDGMEGALFVSGKGA
jgi:hypothetical protein